MPSHELNQWFIANWNPRYKLDWNCNMNIKSFHQWNASKNFQASLHSTENIDVNNNLCHNLISSLLIKGLVLPRKSLCKNPCYLTVILLCLVTMLPANQKSDLHYDDFTWTSCGLKSSVIPLFSSLRGPISKKHHSPYYWPFMRGIHLWPLNSLHKGPVTWWKLPFDDVIMENYHLQT